MRCLVCGFLHCCFLRRGSRSRAALLPTSLLPTLLLPLLPLPACRFLCCYCTGAMGSTGCSANTHQHARRSSSRRHLHRCQTTKCRFTGSSCLATYISGPFKHWTLSQARCWRSCWHFRSGQPLQYLPPRCHHHTRLLLHLQQRVKQQSALEQQRPSAQRRGTSTGGQVVLQRSSAWMLARLVARAV